MVIISKFKPLLQTVAFNAVKQRPMSEHRHFNLVPSRWQWIKFKDYLHFYFMLGLIPVGLIITYANVFIGPATLSEIPEDYVPQHWEYYRSPITRFLAKHVFANPQQEYEKFLSYIYMESEKKKLRQLEFQIKEKLAERQDYQAYYYRPVMAKYHRAIKEAADHLENIRGE